MGSPEFNPKNIPFLSNIKKSFYSLYINKNKYFFGVVSLGNPHCILIVKDINKCEINKIGPILENHYFFPNKVNVSFMQILSKNHILLRVFERDIGETQSCGSGACAAVIVGIKQKKLFHKVKVDLLGGTLKILFNKNKNLIYMLGSAQHIYDGIIYY